MLNDDINDAFMCPECRALGYCIQQAKRNSENAKRKYFGLPIEPFVINTNLITERDISQWVPIRTTIKDANTNFGKKLQKAHELFHQDEFEQASYMYQDMLETRNDCDEVIIGLAAAFYFLKKYEEASSVAIKLNNLLHNSFPYRFANYCETKLKEENAEMISEFELYDDRKTKISDTTLLNEINSII